jgi:hypothetical protein
MGESSQYQPREAATVAVVEDQQLAEEGLQCHLLGAEVVVEVYQEDSRRLADIARKVEAGEVGGLG